MKGIRGKVTDMLQMKSNIRNIRSVQKTFLSKMSILQLDDIPTFISMHSHTYA